MKEEEKKNVVWMWIIALCLFNVIAPITFAWIVEISTVPLNNIVFTNGFFTANPMQIYHLALYLNVITSLATSLILIYREKR